MTVALTVPWLLCGADRGFAVTLLTLLNGLSGSFMTVFWRRAGKTSSWSRPDGGSCRCRSTS